MDKTIDMAREAGFKHGTKGSIWTEDRDGDCTEELKAFEALVRADERNACARLIETQIGLNPDWKKHLAAAIRARGQA